MVMYLTEREIIYLKSNFKLVNIGTYVYSSTNQQAAATSLGKGI